MNTTSCMNCPHKRAVSLRILANIFIHLTYFIGKTPPLLGNSAGSYNSEKYSNKLPFKSNSAEEGK